jgi:hypothetical protein
MKIKLKSDWMDNHEGAILDLKDPYAKSLIDRGIAVAVTEERKGLRRPEVNKMVSTAKDK